MDPKKLFKSLVGRRNSDESVQSVQATATLGPVQAPEMPSTVTGHSNSKAVLYPGEPDHAAPIRVKTAPDLNPTGALNAVAGNALTQSVSELFNSAVRVHKQGNLDKAESLYQELLRIDSRHSDALQYLGMLNGQRGQFDAAVEYLQQALAMAPANFTALSNLGATLLSLGRYESALKNIDAALRIRPDVAQLWRSRGNALLGLHRHADACASFRRALLIQPEMIEVLVSLAMTLSDMEQFTEAVATFRRALDLVPNFAELHANLGMALSALGLKAQAAESYQKAAEIKPDFTEAHNNLGSTLLDLGQFELAAASFRRALEINPDFAEAHANLGSALVSLGLFDDAVISCNRALEIKPNYPKPHVVLCNALKGLDNLEGAFLSCRAALEIEPDFAEAHYSLGVLYSEAKRMAEAEASYLQALAIKSDFTEAHNNLALVYYEAKRLAEAEASFMQVLAINPDYAEAHYNLALLYVETKRLVEAELSYHRALEIKPDFSAAHNNLGLLYVETKRLREAELSYRRALEIEPDFIDAFWNLSILLLKEGSYAEAWPLHELRYDSRRKDPNFNVPALPFPQWHGESLIGKSILIWPEQGFGDYIQFARYTTMLRDRGVSRLTLFCPASLKALLETAAGVDAVISEGTVIGSHDYWTFPLSLPLHFETTIETIPSALPYLQALPNRLERWRDRLPVQGLKVGLVWKGNPAHKNDSNRSLPGLGTLAPLWRVSGVRFVSLQKWQAEDDGAESEVDLPLIHLGSDIVDFADTAAIVAQLDLVICVDTAIAHVAGALGKPCWVLLPEIGVDWRWLLDRTDSPWYPGTMRLFRQTKLEDWNDTVGDVASALQQWTICK